MNLVVSPLIHTLFVVATLQLGEKGSKDGFEKSATLSIYLHNTTI
jgi:hypothetical protein